METESQESKPQHDALITSFCEIASSTKEEAAFFLESHNWDLDAAISTFLDDNTVANAAPAFDAAAAASALSITRDVAVASRSPSPSGSQSPDYSPSRSPSRSRSPSPTPSRRPYELRSRGGTGNKPSGNRARGARTLADLNRPAADDGSDDESDEPQEYNAGGQGRMFVQDPTRGNDVDTIFNQAAQSKALLGPSEHPRSSSSKSFVGQARLLSGESVSAAPQPPEAVNHTITFWTNGFTVDDGPLRRLDDPENAPFLECVKNSTCPPELAPADRRTVVHLEMIRREENYPKPAKQKTAFRGMGRTLGSSSSASSAAPETTIGAASLTTAPLPSMGLVVDDSLPTTSLQLRLADGTRMVSRFNHCHTIRDIRSFIDASRPGGSRSYQLQIMGFPPKQLTDLEQTIEQAGIANSVVIQRL